MESTLLWNWRLFGVVIGCYWLSLVFSINKLFQCIRCVEARLSSFRCFRQFCCIHVLVFLRNNCTLPFLYVISYVFVYIYFRTSLSCVYKTPLHCQLCKILPYVYVYVCIYMFVCVCDVKISA